MRVNRNYVLTEYVLNENDCIIKLSSPQNNIQHVTSDNLTPYMHRKIACLKRKRKEKSDLTLLVKTSESEMLEVNITSPWQHSHLSSLVKCTRVVKTNCKLLTRLKPSNLNKQKNNLDWTRRVVCHKMFTVQGWGQRKVMTFGKKLSAEMKRSLVSQYYTTFSLLPINTPQKHIVWSPSSPSSQD